MGVSALVSHTNGLCHKQKAATANPLASLFFSATQQTPPAPSVPTATSSASNDSTQTKTTTSSIQTKINSSDASNVLDAEIRWCLELIESHSSYR